MFIYKAVKYSNSAVEKQSEAYKEKVIAENAGLDLGSVLKEIDMYIEFLKNSFYKVRANNK